MHIELSILAAAVLGACSLFAADYVSLDGEWGLKYWQQESAESAVREIGAVPPDAKTVKASVPGNCELDLVNAGVMPRPEVGMNVREFRRCEGYGWLYTKDFDLPAGFGGGSRVRLVFDGIDTFADVFLNGEKVGEAANMLIPHSFDVTKALKSGKNRVQVLIRSAFLESQKYDVGELGFHMGFADGEPIRKAGFMGGWDIFPRLYCSGIWRGVRLESVPRVEVDNVAWMFGDFDAEFARCTAKVHFRVKGPMSAYDWGAKARLSLSRGGKAAYSSEREYVAVQNEVKFALDRPALWWPRGMGESALYEAKIEIVGKDGGVLASDVRKVGVRLVKLERDDVYGPDRPGQFLFRVNGEPCYVRGSNWVPLDSFPSRQAGRIVETLEMFEDLNCNMVRVWGGGVYEPEEFFEWCDAHGLMVWQDFMTGCSVFPQDDRYAALTADEVKSVVLMLRNHPSLVLWSGNNENDDAGGLGWGSQREFRQDCGRDRNSRRTIPDVLFEYDVTRPYLPSSPYKSPDVVAGLARPSEMHLWGARGYYKTDYYTNSPCWFASEMGYHGCPDRASLERMMTRECVYPWKGDPAGLDWNDEWRLKASDPYMRGHVHLWRRNDLMTNQVRIMFGGVDTDLDTFVAQSQFVQAEAMKTFCELFRTRKFTRFNGLVWWNVRDGWPQISDAVVDWYGGRKLAYHALKAAQRDVVALLVDDHSAWVVNDLMRPVRGRALYRDRASGKVLLDRAYEVAANSKARLGEVPFSGQGLVDIEYTVDGGTVRRNHFLYGEPPFRWGDVRAWTDGGTIWKAEL
ncbi:MAG: glycoside hydrolase family 2 [Kiritimatiellae bacterium]|nr:glycoside hydrolase family 2 [Kiritimatiellia bacterium]